MKRLLCGVVCAGAMCAGIPMTYAADDAAPAAPAAPAAQAAQDELAQLKEKAKKVEKQLGDANKAVTATDEIKALAQKADDANKALSDAKKAKLDADANYTAAGKAIADAKAKLDGMGCNPKGLPKDATKTLSEQEKTDAEAAVKACKDAEAQKSAIEKALLATDEMKALDQVVKDARKAHSAALQAKIAADPDITALRKELDELRAKIKAATPAPAPAGAGAGAGQRHGAGAKVTFGQ